MVAGARIDIALDYDPSREAVPSVRCRRYAAASAGRADGPTG